jgi:hypothetical protein
MVANDEEFDEIDHYDDDIGQSHEVYVTTFATQVDDIKSDLSIGNDIFNNNYNTEIQFACDSDSDVDWDFDKFYECLEKETVLMTDEAPRSAEYLDDLMLDNKLFKGMSGVRRIPNKDEIELCMDFSLVLFVYSEN